MLATALAASLAATVAQPGTELAPYFGFLPQRTVVVDEGCGPLITADMNDDGRPDLVVVNNTKSRIEIHYLRAEKRSETEQQHAYRVNQLKPNPWYDRAEVSVAHRVTALRAHDADADGRLDIVYAGSDPQELIVLRQDEDGAFEPHARKRVRGLSTTQSGFKIADVLGDEAPELITLVDGQLNAFDFTPDGRLTDATPIGAGEGIVAAFTEDFDGDADTDLLAVVPEDPAPLRLWLQESDGPGAGKAGRLGAELRFEMPALVEVQPIRFPDRDGASIGVIERASRRMVFYDLAVEDVRELVSASVGAERDAQAEVVAFPGVGVSDRSVALADVDADGRVDLLATDPKANAVVLYLQQPGRGLGAERSFSAFKEPKVVAAGQWTGSPAPEVFVLSEEEKTVGVSAFDAGSGRVEFPRPHALSTPGATPVLMSYMTLDDAPALGIVVKDRRDYVLEIHRNTTPGADEPTLEIATYKLEDIRRDPGAVLAADIDQDGATDVLVLTPGEPMIAIDTVNGDVFTKDQMKQFGLVQAAGPDNTALFDMDGDGHDELLIADANFVRACAYDPERGWRVVDQVNADDPSASLAGLALLEHDGETLIVGADRANNRLIFFGRDATGAWGVRQRLRLMGFPAARIAAGRFTGDDEPSILAASDDGFAIVRLAGQRAALEQFAAHRPDAEDRFEHEIEAGDLNGDGYVDLAILDAKEQMCSIYTFSASRRLYPATEFEVFESRLFQRGATREYEPSAALIADLTGDGKDDLALVVHDRVIVYPQMTEADK